MAHFFGRLFKKNTRKGSPSPAYFEALESRQLLSATGYNPTDLVATDWYFIGKTGAGTVAIDGAGVATGTVGTHTLDGIGTTTTVTVAAGGAVTLTSAEGLGNLTGAISSNKNVIALNDNNGGDGALLFKRDTSIAKTDLTGTWSFVNSDGVYTVSLAVKNNVLVIDSLSKVVDGKAVKLDKAGSSIVIDAGSQAFFTLSVKPASGAAETFTGYMGKSDDVAVVVNAGGESSVAFKSATTKSFTSADLPATWYVSGGNAAGNITVDASGSVTAGNLTISAGSNSAVDSPVTGSLKLNADGTISGKLTLNAGTLLANTITVTGRMNLSKNMLELHSADGVLAFTLTTSNDHVATATKAGNNVTIPNKTEVTGGVGKTLSYADIKGAMGTFADIDGDDTATVGLTLTVKSGTLKLNGSVYTKGQSVDIASGDSVTWYTDSTVSTSGLTAGFAAKVKGAADATAVTVRFKRVANEVTTAVSAKTIYEKAANGVTTTTITLTRTNSTGDATVAFTLGGTAQIGAGKDYTVTAGDGGTLSAIVAGKGTIKFTAGDKVVTLVITAVDQATTLSTINRTITFALDALNATDNYADNYEVGSAATTTIKLMGNHIGTALTMTKDVSTITQDTANNSVIFTIKRAATTAGAFSLDYALAGIVGRYNALQVSTSTDGKTWSSWSALGATIDFGATDLQVRVKVTLKADTANKLSDATATFSISAHTGSETKVYIEAANAAASVTVKDYAPTLSTSASATTIAENSSTKVTFSLNTNATESTDVTFTLAGNGNAAVLDQDFAVFAANGTTPLTAVGGIYTLNIAAGSKSASFVIKALADKVRNEGTGKVTIAVANGKYVSPANKVISITDVTSNIAPTISSAVLNGSAGIALAGTTGYSATGADLISATKASDAEDGSSVTLAVTSIAAGVTLKVNGTSYTHSTSLTTLAGLAIGSGDTIVVTVASPMTASASKVLFTLKAKDGEGKYSSAVNITAKIVATPTQSIAHTAATLTAINAGATGNTVGHGTLLTATGAADSHNDPITFVITNIATGITLTKNAGMTAVTVGTEISSTDYLNLPVLTAVSTATELFTVKVKVTANTLTTSQSVISIAVNNTAPSLTAGTIAAATTFSQANATGTDIGVSELVTALSATDASDAPSALTFKVTAIQANVTLKINGVSYTSVSPDLSLASISGTSKITVIVNGSVTIGTATNLFTVEAIDLNSAASSPVLVSGNVTA